MLLWHSDYRMLNFATNFKPSVHSKNIHVEKRHLVTNNVDTLKSNLCIQCTVTTDLAVNHESSIFDNVMRVLQHESLLSCQSVKPLSHAITGNPKLVIVDFMLTPNKKAGTRPKAFQRILTLMCTIVLD